MSKNKVYYSNAKWSKIGISKDEHNNSDDPKTNLKFARSICGSLLNCYGEHTIGCSVRGHCLKTWVTDSKGKKVMR